MVDFEKTKLLTHKGCMDGSVCSIVFQAAGGRSDNVSYVSPGIAVDNAAKDICKFYDGLLIIADLSVSEEVAEYLNFRGNVYLLDHHKTALKLSKYNWCTIDEKNEKCGSMLLYNFVTRNASNPFSVVKLKELVTLADDHDRWIKQYPKTEDLKYLHDFLKQQKFVKRFINDPRVVLSSIEAEFIEHEKDQEKEYIDEVVSKAVFVDNLVDGKLYKIAYALCGNYQSNVGHQLLNDGADLAVLIDKEKVSLRSNDRVDCSVIAELNLGGGHRGASGVRLEGILGKSLLDLVKEKIRLVKLA